MSEIDKESLYGEFMNHERWKDKLHRKVSHKALDIADMDDMIYADNRKSGDSTLGTLSKVLAGAAIVYFAAGPLGLATKAPEVIKTIIPEQKIHSTEPSTDYKIGLGKYEEYEFLK